MSEEIPYPVGRCNCLTKTPDPKYHQKDCPVWLYYAAMDAREELATLKAGLSKMEYVIRQDNVIGIYGNDVSVTFKYCPGERRNRLSAPTLEALAIKIEEK